MARLCFSLVRLGSFWYGLFPCLKKKPGEIPAGKSSRGKDLAGKRPAGKRPGGEKTEVENP